MPWPAISRSARRGCNECRGLPVGPLRPFGNAPSTPTEPAIAPAAQGQGAETRIYVVGSNAVMSDGELGDLIERIRGKIDAGDFALIAANSRQSLDIRD